MRTSYLIIVLMSFSLFACSPSQEDVDQAVSDDITWTKIDIPGYDTQDFRFFKAGGWDGERFILLTSNNQLMSSSNGVDWSDYVVEAGGNIDDISVINNIVFLKVGRYWSVLVCFGWRWILEPSFRSRCKSAHMGW